MSDLYYDTYMEGDAPAEEKSRVSRIVGIVWKTAVITLVLAVFGILIYRMIEMSEPSGTGDFIFDERTLKLYEELGGKAEVDPAYGRKDYAYEKESLKTVTVTKKGTTAEEYEKLLLPVTTYYKNAAFRVFEANTGSYTVTDQNGKEQTVKVTGFYEVTNSPVEGALRANHVYLIPCADQVQLTFRYKSDSLSRLNGQKDVYGNDFTYVLESDSAEKTYASYSFKKDSKGVYRYITMIFDGVDLANVGKLTLLVGYLDEKGEKQTLPIVLYDEALPLPLLSFEVKASEPEKLTEMRQQ